MSSRPIPFYIHYDVDDHFIPMQDFIIAANAAQKIIDDLNKQFFNGQVRYQLMTLPPEDGTFLKTIGIAALFLAANAVLVPIASDYVLGAFEEISSHKPADYGKEHARALRDLAKGFFEKDVAALEKCIPRELNLDRAFKAKTDFYYACQANKNIKALGFDNTKRFPIPNSEFKKHISKDRTRPLDSDFVIYDVIVTSPVTEDKDYVWDFQDIVTGNKVSGYMRDEAFKKGVLQGEYPFKNDGRKSDQLTILVEYVKHERNGEVEKKETCINTVYTYNGKVLVPVPTDLPKGTRYQRKAEVPMAKLWGGQ